jgi:chromosome segregation protein
VREGAVAPVHLKSLTLKGFKSFPDRTRLDFGPGVSVVVGPNGSGKSNVTDALLWAMGEQSPLAVRGRSMQDVIFGGGRGVQARSSAEVEIVLDNSDGTVDVPLGEISIVRRLDRSGEGEYRLNGAHCRLVDVIEVLSDTGLGKETHSVISQGRVEEIVTSKPRDRRLLIEEAAGLGKHRKRRRRAQLKLERTQENLDRALDVEREARTRLRPLKRQAEAAELHERLEHQMLQARWELAREAVRARREELVDAEEGVQAARAAREQIELRLQAVVQRRSLAERSLAERTERHDALAGRAFQARSARERFALRGEQATATAATVSQRASRIEIELGALERAWTDGPGEHDPVAGGSAPLAVQADGEGRVRALEAALAEIDREREREVERELAGLERDCVQASERVAQMETELEGARRAHEHAEERLEAARSGRIWSMTWDEVRQVILDGIERVLALGDRREREIAAGEVAERAELLVKGAVESALGEVSTVEQARDQAAQTLREVERRLAGAEEAQRRATWLIEQHSAAPERGPLAVRRAELQGELVAERRQAERIAAERAERARRIERLRAQRAADVELAPRAERLAAVLAGAGEAVGGLLSEIEELLSRDRVAGEQVASELRACAQEEAEIQTQLRAEGEMVTGAEVAAQRVRDQAAEAEEELRTVCERLELPVPGWRRGQGEGQTEAPAELDGQAEGSATEDAVGPLSEEQAQALRARLERLARRREQLGPVNPLAQEEYVEALAHVEELEARRTDLETALRELRAVIRETDRQIHETFHATFTAAARNFEELVGDVFPGGSGRLRLVQDEQAPRKVLGGQPVGDGGDDTAAEAEAEAELEDDEGEEMLGVEIEITPAGKSTKRLSLLSGGEKSMTALAFVFAVFLARPCPFYVLDEVEAALDDLNLDRFLNLLRRYANRAQFIVITHQKRTMEAADWLYGVSMADNGVSKVLSRRLPQEESTPPVAPVA